MYTLLKVCIHNLICIKIKHEKIKLRYRSFKLLFRRNNKK